MWINMIVGILFIVSTVSTYSYNQNVREFDFEEILSNSIDDDDIQVRANPTWQLVFSDEFAGTALDRNKWEYQYGCDEKYGRGNLHCYVEGTNNVEVKNGLLVITAKIQDREDKHFTTGRIRQLGNGILYGKYIFRARLPFGKNLWPALWLKSKTTSCYQEIDIMEVKAETPSRMIFTAHYGLDRNNIVRHGAANRTTIDFVNDFHIFQMIWTPTQVAWYVDDLLYYQVSLEDRSYWTEPGKSTCDVGPFSQAQNLIINMAVGGSMFNFTPLSPEEARQNWTKTTFEVDYVKVYQLK